MSKNIRTFILSFRPKGHYAEAFKAALDDLNAHIRTKLTDGKARVSLYISTFESGACLVLETGAEHPEWQMNTVFTEALVNQKLMDLMERRNIVDALPQEAAQWYIYS